MTFMTVHIEGSIFTSDILDKIASGEGDGQNPNDFGLKSGFKVKDEITNAWADIQSYWQVFKRRLERISDKESGASETRKYWILPLLDLLGYEIQLYPKAPIVDNQTYNISHRSINRGDFPVHIMGINDSLDKRRESGGPRLSPHALVQEYLNLTSHLYAIVTNGYTLRLLRDSTRLVKLSYIEFDLQYMMDEGHFTDFALMFRLLHSTRMPVSDDSGPESLIEKYHQDSLDSGTRIREGLSEAVKNSIKMIADGFLKHQQNTDLRKWIQENELLPETFYHYLLQLIYRLLFLMVIEDRHLIYEKTCNENSLEIYYKYYSVKRLRDRCHLFHALQDHNSDLWIGLIHTFRLFENEEKGKMLDIKPLSGQLFHSQAIGILNKCKLENSILFQALNSLSYFHHKETRHKIRVNYGALNVEELGSVYEGLLEFSPLIITSNNSYQFEFKVGTDRSVTGSHYTPEELVQPLIKHSLDYLIEERVKQGVDSLQKEKALLSIKVCDATCGSGHILLSAARRIGTELARIRTSEDQPSPTAVREGIRDAITHCIYGVDKNPLAVELCKVSLWLEAHVPGKPLNFLDHHIKCGDAIVGLAHHEELLNGIPDEAFKKMPGDDSNVLRDLAKRNKKERQENLQRMKDMSAVKDPMEQIIARFKEFSQLPEDTAQQIANKEEQYRKMVSGIYWKRMKVLADLQVTPFYIPKTLDTIDRIVTQADYIQYLKGYANVSPLQVEVAEKEAKKGRFFHWFLQFPDVFINDGFDCILGNPPYLGGQGISGAYGDNYLNYIKTIYAPASGCDLVTYFLRRDFDLIKEKGFNALITTNSVSEGRMREGGLEVILSQGGNINFAQKSMRWPGVANLYVSLLSLIKGTCPYPRYIDNRLVEYISPFFEDTRDIGNPFLLNQNKKKMFQGSIFLGEGFLLNSVEKDRLIALDPKNSDVIFPVLNGKDINEKFDQVPDRYIINFFDWSEEQAQNYTEPYRIVKEKVKPVRDKDNRVLYKERWWLHAENRPGLYKTLQNLKRCFVVTCTTKYLSFSEISTGYIFLNTIFIYTNENFSEFLLLQSTLHEMWARKYSSKIGMGLRYTPSVSFETFPFPQNISTQMEQELEQIGEHYHEFRKQLMLHIQLGLTKIYNLFHNPNLSISEIIKESKKDTDSAQIAFTQILQLRELHKQMDNAVLKAYGWTDINLAHDFYEVDYLPENDRIRFTISPNARKEILKRLLLLNHQIHELEEKEFPNSHKTSKKLPSPKSIQKSLFD